MARRLSVVALRSPRTRVWFITCPWISVELEARVHGEHENDHKAAVDDVAEDFQIVESGATVSAEEFHQGVGLRLGETDVEKVGLCGQGHAGMVLPFKGWQCAARRQAAAKGGALAGGLLCR